MNRAQMLALLTEWQERMQACDRALAELSAVVGSSPEGPLQSAVSALMGMLTAQVAQRCGFGGEWLEAWWIEHQFGARPMQAGLVGEPMRDLRTLDDLLALIVDDINADDADTAPAAKETD